MGSMYIPDTEENNNIRCGIVKGIVEILPSNVSNARKISQFALAKYYGGNHLEAAVFSPGGEPFSLPVPTRLTSSLCTFCSSEPRHGHSPFCVSCIGQKANINFIRFYGAGNLFWHYALIALIGLALIFGIAKCMPRPEKINPVSTPVNSLKVVSFQA